MGYFYNSYKTDYCFYAGPMHTKEEETFEDSENYRTHISSACFAGYFGDLGVLESTEVVTDTIEFFIRNTPNYGTGLSNSTACTKDDIIWYMEYLKNNLFSCMEYEVDDPTLYPKLNIKEIPSYRVKVTTTGNKNIRKHVCILTRFLYEFPMNYCLKEAILIMNNYNLDSKINLFDLIHLCWVTNFGNTGTLHYMGNTSIYTAYKVSLELFKENLGKNFQIFDAFDSSIGKSYNFEYHTIDDAKYTDLLSELRPDVKNRQTIRNMAVPEQLLYQPFEDTEDRDPEYLHDFVGLHLRYELIYKPILNNII